MSTSLNVGTKQGTMTILPDMAPLRRILRTGAATWRRTTRPARATPTQQPLWPRAVRFNTLIAWWLLAIIVTFAYLDEPMAQWARVQSAHGTWAHSVFSLITELGRSGWVLLSAFVAFMVLAATRWDLLINEEKRRVARAHGAAFFLFMTVGMSGVVISIVKYTIGRARPGLMDQFGPHHFAFPVWESAFASFPSGHSTTFGAVAMAVALIFPKYRHAFFLMAIIGASSRVMVGAHWISDAVAGAGCGALIVLLSARFLARRGTLFRFDGTAFPRLARTG